MSKSFASGRHASSSSGCRQTRSVRVWTRIQRLRTPRAFRAARELEAPRGMVPEEVVGDEDGVADRREVVHHGADRALAEGAVVELPHRAEVAAEGAAARGLDEPHGLEEEAVVAVAVALDEIARAGSGTRSSPVRSASGARRDPAVRRAQPQGRHSESGRPAASASTSAGTTSSPSSTQIASTSVASSGPEKAAAAWPPTRMNAPGASGGPPAPSRGRGRTRARACRRCRRRADARAEIHGARPEPKRRSTIAGVVAARRAAPRRCTRGRAARRGRTARGRTARCPGSGLKSRTFMAIELYPPACGYGRPARNATSPRARKKWVSHGLSNRIVYGGLHYGGHWLPMPVLNMVNLVGNSLAATFMRENGGRHPGQLRDGALGASAAGRRASPGRSSSSTAATRSTPGGCAARPSAADHDLRRGRPRPLGCPPRRPGFLLVTGHVGNWEMGAVTLRGHA